MGQELSTDLNAFKKKADVSLANRNLKSVPQEIKMLSKYCQSLNLSHNTLTELPSELGQLWASSFDSTFSDFNDTETSDFILIEISHLFPFFLGAFQLGRLLKLKVLDFSFNSVNQFPLDLPWSSLESLNACRSFFF